MHGTFRAEHFQPVVVVVVMMMIMLTTTGNIYIGQCTQTAESANVKVQNILHGRNNITCRTDCKYRTSGMLYIVETWFVSGM